MIAKTWTLTGLSAELGIDRRSLARKLTDLPPDEQTEKNGRTERRWRLARVVAHLASPTGEGLDLNQERAALARVQRHKVEIELAELRGEVVRLPVVEQHWQGMVASMRAKLLSLPSKIAAQTAGPDRLQLVESRAQVLVYEALEEIAHGGVPPAVTERIARAAEAKAEADHADAA